jgi:hypothetical protein
LTFGAGMSIRENRVRAFWIVADAVARGKDEE